MIRNHRKPVVALVSILGVLSVITFVRIQVVDAPEDKPRASTEQQKFDKSKLSTSNPSSLWLVVNKKRPISANFTPVDLVTPDVPIRSGGEESTIRSGTAKALETFFAAAKKQGHDLLFVSGYRSHALQTAVYNRYVGSLGQAEADRVSARPGTSEHQTGLAADVGTIDRMCELETCFGDTPAGKWIAKNAHDYGFIVRYPKGKESITGYSYEPWHLRYVGKELANELHRTKVSTLEEFFGL